jgi:glutathione S-transferase
MSGDYRLITIPPSHFCEKARWALDRYGASYVEEPHPPVLHYRPTRRAGGGRTVPVLVTDVGVFADSSDILRFLDGRHGDGGRLFPEESDLRADVDELEELFDSRLGPHTRRVAYFHLLPHRELLLESVLDRVPKRDQTIFRATLPGMRWLLRRGMRITADAAQRSLDLVREVFRTVGERLADDRSFLVGDRFTAADLTFAALAAPVVLPRGYGSRLPTLADLPSSFLPLIEEMRTTGAGEFALRLYRDER